MKTPLNLIVAAILLGFSALGAQAQTSKAWVSGSGADSGNCPVYSPCRTFAYAVTQTTSGGEILVEDSAGYGAVTITRAVTIAAEGVLASVPANSGASGITITAGTNDVVILRGLTIDGHGTGLNGIYATQAAKLVVQDCVLQGMTGAGIEADSNGPLHELILSNVTAQNNNIGANVTLLSAGIFNVSVVNSRFSYNSTGLGLSGGNASVFNSIFSFNTQYGINNTGDILNVGGSIFYLNATSNFGAGYSFGDNDIHEFGGIQGTLTPVSKQ